MAVYVDDMRAKFGNMIMCHMIADTLDELNHMADLIGVQRKWLQTKSHIHYDIALSKRSRAIACGAIEITWRQMSFMVRNREYLGFMPSPIASKTIFHICRYLGFDRLEDENIKNTMISVARHIERVYLENPNLSEKIDILPDWKIKIDARIKDWTETEEVVKQIDILIKE